MSEAAGSGGTSAPAEADTPRRTVRRVEGLDGLRQVRAPIASDCELSAAVPNPSSPRRGVVTPLMADRRPTGLTGQNEHISPIQSAMVPLFGFPNLRELVNTPLPNDTAASSFFERWRTYMARSADIGTHTCTDMTLFVYREDLRHVHEGEAVGFGEPLIYRCARRRTLQVFHPQTAESIASVWRFDNAALLVPMLVTLVGHNYHRAQFTSTRPGCVASAVALSYYMASVAEANSPVTVWDRNDQADAADSEDPTAAVKATLVKEETPDVGVVADQLKRDLDRPEWMGPTPTQGASQWLTSTSLAQHCMLAGTAAIGVSLSLRVLRDTFAHKASPLLNPRLLLTAATAAGVWSALATVAGQAKMLERGIPVGWPVDTANGFLPVVPPSDDAGMPPMSKNAALRAVGMNAAAMGVCGFGTALLSPFFMRGCLSLMRKFPEYMQRDYHEHMGPYLAMLGISAAARLAMPVGLAIAPTTVSMPVAELEPWVQDAVRKQHQASSLSATPEENDGDNGRQLPETVKFYRGL